MPSSSHEQMFEELNEHQPTMLINSGNYSKTSEATQECGYFVFSQFYLWSWRYETWSSVRIHGNGYLNTKKTAVFIVIPETNNAFNFSSQSYLVIGFEVLTHKVYISRKHEKCLTTVEKIFCHIQFIFRRVSVQLAVFQTSPVFYLLFVVVRCLLRLSSAANH